MMLNLLSPRLACSVGRWFVVAGLLACRAELARAQPSAIEPRDAPFTGEPETSPAAPAMLPPLNITAPPYQPPLTKRERLKLGLFFKWNLDWGWPALRDDFVLTPHRIPENPRNIAVAAAAATVDSFSNKADPGEWRSHAGFARILRDGVPLIDPFGNGDLWHGMPREGLVRVETVPRGGANAWGDGALGGVVQFFTAPAKGRLIEVAAPLAVVDRDYAYAPKRVVAADCRLAAWAGNFGILGIDFVTAQPTSNGVLQVLGRTESASGRPLVAAGDRGPVDSGERRRERWIESRWRQRIGGAMELLATLGTTERAICDGTPGRRHSGRGQFGSIAVAGEPSVEVAWNAVVYAQKLSRDAAFTSIASDRTREMPQFEQTRAPAQVFGAAWTGRWLHARDAHTAIGADANLIDGEVRNDFEYRDGKFARESIGGGQQQQMGVFVYHDREIRPDLRLTLGTRFDAWSDDNAHGEIFDCVSGVRLGRESVPGRRGKELSPELGVIWRPTQKARAHIDFQGSFRRPTLGQRFAIEGRRATIVQPDANLSPEHGRTITIGAEYAPTATMTLAISGFSMALGDAIGEVAVAPAEFAGYESRRRVNFAFRRIEELKWSAAWHQGKTFAVEAGVVFNRAAGFAFVPRRKIVLGATWKVGKKFMFAAQVRSEDSHFADDENRQKVPGAVVGDLRVGYALRTEIELFVTATNVGDAHVELERGADGIDYVDAPRLVEAGLRFGW